MFKYLEIFTHSRTINLLCNVNNHIAKDCMKECFVLKLYNSKQAKIARH